MLIDEENTLLGFKIHVFNLGLFNNCIANFGHQTGSHNFGVYKIQVKRTTFIFPNPAFYNFESQINFYPFLQKKQKECCKQNPLWL